MLCVLCYTCYVMWGHTAEGKWLSRLCQGGGRGGGEGPGVPPPPPPPGISANNLQLYFSLPREAIITLLFFFFFATHICQKK